MIEEMKIEELNQTLELVKKVFDEFEAPLYSKNGIESFYKFANYDNIKENLNKNLKIFIEKRDNKIVGMLCLRDCLHIAMLFVDVDSHRNCTNLFQIKRNKKSFM